MTSAARITCALIACLGLFSCGGSKGPIDGDRAYQHVAKLVGFGPRPAGSEELAASAAYIGEQLQALGLEMQVQEFQDEKAPGVTFRNLWTEIPGSDPTAGPVVVLAAHYDTKLADGHDNADHNFPFVGAIDGAGASGLLLELARHLTQRPDPGANIWLVWFDGEESIPWDWDHDRSLFGSRHFVRTMIADKERFPRGLRARMKALVLMDLIGDKNIKLDRDGNSNKELQDLFGEVAKEMGEEERMYSYRSSFTDDHIPFNDAGVRVIDLIDFKFRAPSERMPNEPPEIAELATWWHTNEDTLDKVSADSLAFVGNLVWLALPRIEEAFCR